MAQIARSATCIWEIHVKKYCCRFFRRARGRANPPAAGRIGEMFDMDRTKNQGDEVPSAAGLPPEVIVSPDAARAERIPPGQSRTKKWPVLDASGAPKVDLTTWRFTIGGLVMKSVEWNWEEFSRL